MTQLGALIPKLHCDSISRHEAKAFLEAVNTSHEFREACRNMGFFASDIAEFERRERARMCLELLFSTAHPPAAISGDSSNPARLSRSLLQSFSSKPYFGLWKKHVAVVGEWDPNKTQVFVSDELYDRARALEAFWATPDCLVTR